jgi:hypothetical protein
MKNMIIALFLISLLSCKDDDPILDAYELLGFEVEATGEFDPYKTYIDTASNQILVFSSSNLELNSFPLSLNPVVTVSPGASVSPSSGSAVVFDDPEDFVIYTITAQDGLGSDEYIFTIRDNQIPNAGFENWFDEIGMNAQPFLQPGKYSESTVWATTNMGTSIYSIYGTTPFQDGNNKMAKIETVETVAIPIVAGAMYLGEFDLDAAIADPGNPVAAAKLGIPFFAKPTAIQFKYSYESGDQLIQAALKDPGNLFGGFDIYNLEGTDKFGINAVLEKRTGDMVTIIAQAVFESDQEVDTMTELKMELQYLSDDDPTHFHISFSPSVEGGMFKGAIGSSLIIDELKMIYE